jgi:hypothetical protein
MTEPLADGRDEVIYLVCTHPRVALGQNVYGDVYDTTNQWARVRFPDGVRPSALGWAVLDPLLETVEGLPPNLSFDPTRDPEGEAGRHRDELLPWIFDRHLETARELEIDRGEVQGAQIDFRLEYIGKSDHEALRRASGAHHKVPLILHRILLYEPERLVYFLPCDIRAATYESERSAPSVDLLPLVEAASRTGIPRDLLISAAEEALIAGVGAPANRRNVAARRFPCSGSGERLAILGMHQMFLGFIGLPHSVAIHGEQTRIECDSRAIEFRLSPG